MFTCRYIDLLWNFASLYNSVLKIVFLGTSYLTVYWMRTTYRSSYDKEHDSFRVLFLIAPCALLTLLVHDYEVTWLQLPFEVRSLAICCAHSIVTMDLLYLPRGPRHLPPALPPPAHRRGGDLH